LVAEHGSFVVVRPVAGWGEPRLVSANTITSVGSVFVAVRFGELGGVDLVVARRG